MVNISPQSLIQVAEDALQLPAHYFRPRFHRSLPCYRQALAHTLSVYKQALAIRLPYPQHPWQIQQARALTLQRRLADYLSLLTEPFYTQTQALGITIR